MLACAMMRLPNVDRVVALKFPAYYVPHDDKVVWLLHQFRQVYDLWGTPYQDLPSDITGQQVRESVIRSDNALLARARKIYTNSEVTARRLHRFNGIESEVLHPPLLHEPAYAARTYGDYVFCPSRITAGKRQLLLIEAMKHVRTPVRLVLAGMLEGCAAEDVQRAIHAAAAESRVTLLPGFLPEADKVAFIEGALAGVYVPVDEDSYGYVTMEHFLARKAVVTTTDSGGITILVKDGVTGFVVDPAPEAIAGALDRLYADRALARTLGTNAFELLRSMRITWDNVVQKLTA
jgi:glycosyltransferase involved in cell wall biosynthesis